MHVCQDEIVAAVGLVGFVPYFFRRACNCVARLWKRP